MIMKNFYVSRAFKRGLLAGLAAPSLLFWASRRQYRVSSEDLVERAWKDVGSDLDRAMNAIGEHNGKRAIAKVNPKTYGRERTAA